MRISNAKLLNLTRYYALILIAILSINAYSQSLPDNIDISGGFYGVVELPSTVPAAFANGGFVKYTKIQCPNGEAIHFVAQDQVTDAMVVRARTLLEFYLKDLPGSEFGADKTNVTNTMGTNDATLVLMNGAHGEGPEPTVNGQELYQNEMTVEGSDWYQNNNFEYRDASFEEILHMMHDMGIGVDGPNSISNPALPAYQQEIRAAQDNADNGFEIWPLGGNSGNIQGWYNELDAENSLSQEYLASVIDSYYGLWDPWTEDPNTGMWGVYIAHNRAEIQTEDPMGWALLPKFFSPTINVDMIIDPTFSGTFSMTFESATSYTAKSRYMQHAYLTGSNASSLQGNSHYNRLKGNSANNTFEGMAGNDRLDGAGGNNTAIFSGESGEYTVTNLNTHAIVLDLVDDRDGVDTLWNMHMLQFTDQTVTIDLQTVGIEETSEGDLEAVTVYPNPANSHVWIDFPATISSPVQMELRDQRGRLIIKEQLMALEQNKIDIATLESGTYLMLLQSETGRKVVKLIK